MLFTFVSSHTTKSTKFISCCYNKYRISAVLKVETDIITSIVASPKGQTVILVIMYVEIFKTGIIVYIGDVKMCLTSHYLIIFNISQFLHMRVTNRPNILLIKVRSVIQTFSAAHIKGKMSKLPMI